MFEKSIILKIAAVVLAACFLSSCVKEAPDSKPGDTGDKQAPAAKTGTDDQAAVDGQADAGDQADGSDDAAGDGLAPLPIVLPKPMFVGTPQNFQVPNLEPPRKEPRPEFYAPQGVTNAALDMPVDASDNEPIIGEIDMITDGDKEASDGSYVELGPFLQHVTIDLGAEHEIYALLVWHFHQQARVYFDVIVQLADDIDFTQNVRTIFNNDHDNSAGMGVGTDKHYVETAEGKLIDAGGNAARFVRLYSNGNSQNDLNHYIEVEVYGRPLE